MEIAKRCDCCGGPIYVGEAYTRVDKIDMVYCDECTRKDISWEVEVEVNDHESE